MAKKKAVKKVAKKKAAKKITKKAAPVTRSAVAKKTAGLLKGDRAPEFTLPDQNGVPVSLSDFRGRNVVAYFYPRALTPGCTVQACGLRDSKKKLLQKGIVVLAISADPVKKLKQFEEKHDLNFYLLSDENKDVIKAYGSWGLKKFMGREFEGILRQTFLLDKKGNIIHVMHKVNTGTHHEDVMEFFKSYS